MSVRIGCDNLVYAIMTTEETATTAPVYETPKICKGVMSLNVSPETSSETLFADDGPLETATTLGGIQVELQKSELTTAERADLLGHTIDADGGLISASEDVPPYVAVGFRAMKSNGKYKYTWLYKGKFQEPEAAHETKGDTINFQTDTLTGNFVKLANKMKIKTSADDTTGRLKSIWKYDVDQDDTAVKEETISTFFTSVKMPPVVTP